MVRKSNPPDEKDSAGPFDGVLADQVRASAQQIWLAGMGAFARAQAEGTKMFESLVKDGGVLQKKTQGAAEDRLGAMTKEMASKVSGFADDVQTRAGEQWGKLEGLFDDGAAKTLKKLGMPSAKDFDALSARVDALGARLDALSSAATKTTPAAAKTRARETGRVDELSAMAPDSPTTREIGRIDELDATAPTLPAAKKAPARKVSPAKRVTSKKASAKPPATKATAKKAVAAKVPSAPVRKAAARP